MPYAFGMRRSEALVGLALLVSGCTTPARVADEAAASGELLASVRRRKTLRIATDGNYFPQSYRNADGSWSGFDVDVARELARRLGVATHFDDVSFDLITAGHWSGRFDVHVGSMTVTAERKADLRFTRPYYYIPATFAVHATSALARIGQLDGKRVGVGRATTYESYFGETLRLVDERIAVPPPRTQPISYDTDAEAIDDLALGDGLRLDAVLTALPTLNSAIAGGRKLKVIDRPVFEDDCAVALDRFAPQRNGTLVAAFDGFLADMHRDGTLARFSKHHYGIDLTARG